PSLLGTPIASAQVPGITFCPVGTFGAANVNCSTSTTIFCPGGGLAGPLQACPINPPLPSILNSSPLVSVNLLQTCANGIVLSVSQSCPSGGAVLPTSAAARALQQGAGHYCNLANGGQVWVPAGASPAAMGCSAAAASGR